MSAPTVGLAAITAGEPTLEKMVENLRPHVDQVVLVLTREVGPEREAQVAALADVFEKNLSWLEADGFFANFGAARQRSFDLLETDCGIWADSDDAVRGAEALRDIAAELPEGPSILKLPYEYEHDAGGRVTTHQWRERLVRPVSAFQWQFRVHEALVQGSLAEPSVAESDGVVFVHGRSGPGNVARNARILRLCLAEDPGDLRAAFYLGLELFKLGEWAECRAVLEAFAESRAHPEERVMALLRLSDMARTRGDVEEAIARAMQAHSLRPWDSCCFSVARAFHAVAERSSGGEQRGAWEHAAFWCRAGLAQPPARTDLWSTPLDRAGLVDVTLHAALAALGDPAGALESLDRAIAVLPGEPSLQACRLVYEARLGRLAQEEGRRRAEAAAARSEALRRRGLVNRATRDAVHAEGGLPVGRPEGSLDFVFACGEGPETWNPQTMEDRGIGGSEQAVVNLARCLSRRGHRVRVYANCGHPPKFYDGVEYLPTRAILKAGAADVLVAWRDAAALEVALATVRVAWAHDTRLQGVNEWRGALVDRVVAVSGWHAQHLANEHPEVPLGKFHASRNGVDLSLFDLRPPPARDPARAVYSSSPTRGLDELLEMWPTIVARARQMQPSMREPSLHVFYGMESTLAAARSSGDGRLIQLVERLEKRMGGMEGVVYRGRVPPRELAREMLSAGCWLYPSWDTLGGCPWLETSCIGAMEAQVAGLRVATLAAGALPETIGEDGCLVAENSRSPAFVELSARALSGPWPTKREEIARVGRERFAWEPVAEDWERLAKELLAAKRGQEVAAQ